MSNGFLALILFVCLIISTSSHAIKRDDRDVDLDYIEGQIWIQTMRHRETLYLLIPAEGFTPAKDNEVKEFLKTYMEGGTGPSGYTIPLPGLILMFDGPFIVKPKSRRADIPSLYYSVTFPSAYSGHLRVDTRNPEAPTIYAPKNPSGFLSQVMLERDIWRQFFYKKNSLGFPSAVLEKDANASPDYEFTRMRTVFSCKDLFL